MVVVVVVVTQKDMWITFGVGGAGPDDLRDVHITGHHCSMPNKGESPPDLFLMLECLCVESGVEWMTPTTHSLPLSC
jgi:hypothetical protein